MLKNIIVYLQPLGLEEIDIKLNVMIKTRNKYKRIWCKIPIKSIPSSLTIEIPEKYIKKEDTILDIGCGNGTLLLNLYKTGYRNLYGIDINPTIEDFSKSKLPIRYLVQDCANLNFGNDSFDVAIMKALLTIVVSDYSILKTLEEAYRVLKPNGKLIIKDFFQNWHMPLYRERYIKHIVEYKDNKCIFPVFNKTGELRYYARHFNTQELSQMLIKVGFHILEVNFSKEISQSGNNVIGFTIIAKKQT